MLEPLFDEIFGRSYRTAVPLANLYPQWIYRMSAEVVDEVGRIRSGSAI
jgi:hypothetical protein